MTNRKPDYAAIIDLLRKSKPSIDQQTRLEERILEQVEKKGSSTFRLDDIVESLFAWVNMPWLRRCLIAVSMVLVVIFVIQQSILVNQVRDISRQVIVFKNDIKPDGVPDIGSKLVLYRFSDRLLSKGEIRISGKDLEKIIGAYNELDGRYKDLLRIIGENPEIRNYVEKKLSEEQRYKPNL